jgi:hypothetical protein
MKVRFKPVQEVVESQLDQLMTLADRVWREQIEEAERAHATAAAGWRLESARLAARFGSGSDRAARAAELGDAHTAARADLEAERERLKTPSPRPQSGSAVLHGRVNDATGAGISGLTVRMVDEDGSALATTRTSSGGQYRIVLPLTDETRVFLEIARAGARLHADEEPTIAAPGGMLFREIVVDVGAARPRTARSRRAVKRPPRADRRKKR